MVILSMTGHSPRPAFLMEPHPYAPLSTKFFAWGDRIFNTLIYGRARAMLRLD